MPILFDCTCGKKVQAPESLAGKRVRCPHCQSVIQVPEPILDAEEVAPPAPIMAKKPPAAPASEPETFSFQDEEEAPAAPDPSAKRRPCPMCGEMILANAVKCRFCGEVFDETLRKAEKKKAGKDEDANMNGGEWALCILCSGIGCIVGVVYMLQGKPKGIKMLGVSLVVQFIFGFLRVLIEAAAQR